MKLSKTGLSPLPVLVVLLALGAGLGVWVFSQPKPLGPADGHDLPGIDTARVQVGDPAPDFRLTSFEGDVVSLSDFEGEKEVVLVFYRGHW